MDYRKRYYFLINVKKDYNNDKLNLLKRIAPSLKISAPIGHFKNKYYTYDYQNTSQNYWTDTLFHMNHITHLVSIKKEDFYFFVKFLSYMSNAKAIFYKQLCKDDTKQ